MSQTSIIAASLIVAYIVFITVRGELPAYLGVLTGKGTPDKNSGVSGATSSGSSGSYFGGGASAGGIGGTGIHVGGTIPIGGGGGISIGI